MDSQERILGVVDIFFKKVVYSKYSFYSLNLYFQQACEDHKYCCVYGKLCKFFRKRQIEKLELGHRKTELRLFYYLLIQFQTDMEEEKSIEAYCKKKLQAIEKAVTVTKSFYFGLGCATIFTRKGR